MRNLTIRPVRIEDAEQINYIRTMQGVFENICSVYSERISQNEAFIANLSKNNNHVFVAEIKENGIKKVVGVSGLFISENIRCRHSAEIGMMIHTDYQNRGIGKILLNKQLDLADNWLMLGRLELTVFTDNDCAINLYKNAGFVEEGIKKYAITKHGKYVDLLIMARYNFRST